MLATSIFSFSNNVFNPIKDINHHSILSSANAFNLHLSVLSWSSFNQNSAQYSFQATGCLHTWPLLKKRTTVREEGVLSQWLSSILRKNIGQAEDWTSDILFSSPSAMQPTELWGSVKLVEIATYPGFKSFLIFWHIQTQLQSFLGILLINKSPFFLVSRQIIGVYFNFVSPYPGCSMVNMSGLKAWWLFETWLRWTFFPAHFPLSPLLKACEKSSRWLWKESSVITGVRKPGNTCASPPAMIWP